MKRVLLFIFALSVVGGVKAKQEITTLWEDTYTGAIELNATTVGTFIEGDVLRIYLNLSQAGNFGISYKSEGNGWHDTAIPSINSMWPWISATGDTYYDVTFTSADITALSEQNIYIAKGDDSTPTKVELRHTLTPSSETQLLSENWTASWTAKSFAAQSEAKIGDVLQIKYTAYKNDTEEWPWVQFYFTYSDGNNIIEPIAGSKQKNSETIYEYEITSATVLEKIQSGGFAIKGDLFILTSVKLLSYSDSYDAVSVTIGSDEIATWSHSKNLNFNATGITAYYASSVTTGSITLTPTATTWNYQGYILKGNAGTYTVPVIANSEAFYPSPNYLKQSVGSTDVAASTGSTYHYIFAKMKTGDANVGFYKLTSDHTLAAHKAYLETSDDITPASSARIALVFDDEETTGINTVKGSEFKANDNTYYDLSGRRVAQPSKGLYIVNGKKVVIK